MLKKLITISITALVSLQAATTYDKSLSDGNDNLNYWSDTTDSNLTNHTLVGATEVFTIGSRKNIPNVPTSSIKVSTNKLCSNDRKGLVSCSKTDSLEPRYTDDGIYTSGEISLRTWYKATTPKSVNGVVDNPCTTLSNTGSVVNWWADFSNLRCERTITTYSNKVMTTVYAPKVISNTIIYTQPDIQYDFLRTFSISSTDSSKKDFIVEKATINVTGYKVFTSSTKIGITKSTFNGVSELGILMAISDKPGILYTDDNYQFNMPTISNANSISVNASVDVYKGSQVCYNGTLINGQCEESATKFACPSGYFSISKYSNICSKTAELCPDTSWTDTGANCKKNVPEYKLFSTF
jgi:hypothetical protein